MPESTQLAAEEAALPLGGVPVTRRGEPPPGRNEQLPRSAAGTLSQQVRPLLLAIVLLTLLTGAVFPLLLAALARPLFPRQAGGSLIERDGVVVGSELIGQSFTGPGYFHPRPSAAGKGYDGLSSGGSNLSPTNPKLRDEVRSLADEFRRVNKLAADAAIPIDAVTRSGSGLDPHISRVNATLQLPRVARERGMDEQELRRLVARHTRGRQLGILGQPCVRVLALNLALDRIAPLIDKQAGR